MNAAQEHRDHWESSGGGCDTHRLDIDEASDTERVLLGSSDSKRLPDMDCPQRLSTERSGGYMTAHSSRRRLPS